MNVSAGEAPPSVQVRPTHMNLCDHWVLGRLGSPFALNRDTAPRFAPEGSYVAAPAIIVRPASAQAMDVPSLASARGSAANRTARCTQVPPSGAKMVLERDGVSKTKEQAITNETYTEPAPNSADPSGAAPVEPTAITWPYNASPSSPRPNPSFSSGLCAHGTRSAVLCETLRTEAVVHER